MSADKAQRTFDATPARKQKAKRDGNVARSTEVSGIAAFACAASAAVAVLPAIGDDATGALRTLCAHPGANRLPVQLAAVLGLGLVPAAAAALGATCAGLMQAGGLQVTVPKWQWSRLDPVAGLKRMVGGQAVTGALRAGIAFAVVTLAVGPVALDILARAATLAGVAAFAELARDGAARVCWATIAVGAACAVVDYALVRRRWLRELKMTFEEIRRDQKENDGDPGARSRRKALHRSFVRGSIARTKDATFVVVNPTHIAIAIRYAPPTTSVPEILVRAVDEGAAQVKFIARKHGIPIIENVTLARALHAHGSAGRTIPSQTFVAVAHVIAALMREGVLA
jgi:flagellar biosynthesis protein FlhB